MSIERPEDSAPSWDYPAAGDPGGACDAGACWGGDYAAARDGGAMADGADAADAPSAGADCGR